MYTKLKEGRRNWLMPRSYPASCRSEMNHQCHVRGFQDRGHSGRFLLAEETFSDGHPIEVSFSTKVLRTSGSWSPLCDPGFLIDVHELFGKDPPGPVDIHLELLKGGPAMGPHGPLLIGGTETDCVSVGVGDCSQESNRTLAVQRRNDSHRDFIAGV